MSCEQTSLYVVATPLGNDDDLSPRARAVLGRVDAVLAEDTRRARQLFDRCGLRVKALEAFHDHNERDHMAGILARLKGGSVLGLVSDAGMPLVADPGYRLVRACRDAGVPVTVVPGPCAPVTALAGSGIAPLPFTFLGFLPRSEADIEAALRPFAQSPTTLVIFERKDRLEGSLKVAAAILGPRELCVARELTKPYEEFITGRLERPPDLGGLLGEITVVIGPPEGTAASSREEVLALIERERPAGGPPRDIARRVRTGTRGWTMKDIYAMVGTGGGEGHGRA